MIGTKLLHYEIVEKLGEGGMGVVYKARDTHLDRFVAVKVLPPEKVADAGRKARFVQEAKAASALNHPNIITVYDISSDGGTDFIAMEHVAGKTLDQLIPRKGMRLNDALKIAVQIADALTRAHAAGIVHRDLKPGNIMVTGDGLVKVLDFGLAKLTETALGEDEATRTVKPHTEEGTIVGTAAYMSPEQAEGKTVDARSDIFSFGAVLYEMVTGARAFRGDSRMSTLSAVLHKEPPAFPVYVPRELQRVVARCLKKDPERRFQHVSDVRVALLELKEESDSGTLEAVAGQSPRPRRPLLWVGAALPLIALAAAGLAWRSARLGGEPETEYRAVPFTSYPGLESDPALSPDGNQVAFAWRGENQDNLDIYVRLVGTGMGRPLRITTDPEPDYSPAFSPDGRMIAFLRDISDESAAAYVVTALGGAERRVAEIPGLPLTRASEIVGRYLTWAPDGKHLAVTYPVAADQSRAMGLFLVDVEAGAMRALTQPPDNRSVDSCPAFSPDGKTLAFVRGGVSNRDLYSVPLGKDFGALGEPRRVTSLNTWVNGLAWTEDGREIIFSSGHLVGQALWRVAAPGGAGPRRLQWAGEGGFLPATSRSGRRLVYQTYNVNKSIWRLELARPGVAAGKPHRIIASSQYDEAPAYAPDGRRIAFVSVASGAYEIWVAEDGGGNPRALTAMGKGMTSSPDWSPDGKRIAFFSSMEGQSEIYTINAEGGGLRRVTNHPASDYYPSYSHDGRWIYFTSVRSGPNEVWKAPADGGEAVQVTHGGGARPHESPDGNFLYYLRSSPRLDVRDSLVRMPAGGGDPEMLLPGTARIHKYEVTGEGIYFVPWWERVDRTRWQFYRFADGKTQTVAEATVQNYPYFSVSRDGRKMLYTDPGTVPGDIMLVENFR
jgi:Tol biopolymer transport system component/predicted Ser/Thr protein kinase